MTNSTPLAHIRLSTGESVGRLARYGDFVANCQLRTTRHQQPAINLAFF
jgi:hypothetical protein